MSLAVKCPACGRLVEWCEDSKYRPFCSERCSLVDLGGWLSERNTIPGEPAPGEEDVDQER